MRYIRYFLVLGLAAMVFAGALFSEKSRWEQLKTIENPFQAENAQAFFGEIILAPVGDTQDFFTQEGEWFRLFPDTEILASELNRNVKRGTLLWSTQFFDDRLLDSAWNLKPGEVFSSSVVRNAQGLLRFQDLWIYPHKGVVLAQSGPEGVRLWAQHHPIEIRWEGRSETFLLPAGASLFYPSNFWQRPVGDDTATEQSSTTRPVQTFEDLFQALGVESWNGEEVISLSEENEIPLSRVFGEGDQALQRLQETFHNFAEEAPQSWTRYRLTTLPGKVLSMIQKLQRFVIVSPSKKERLAFLHLVGPYAEAYRLQQEGRIDESHRFLEQWKKLFNGSRWNLASLENNIFKSHWIPYERALRSVLFSVSGSDEISFLENFWFEHWQHDDFAPFRQKWHMLENIFAQQSFPRLEQEMTKFHKAFQTTPMKAQWYPRLTELRHLLGTSLRLQKDWWSESAFSLYADFLDRERKLLQTEEQIRVFQEENALWVSNLLVSHIGEEITPAILEKLLELYDQSKAPLLVSSEGVPLIASDTQALIEVVRQVGTTNLTSEEIINIQKLQDEQEMIQDQLSSVQRPSDDDDSQIFSEGHIANAKALKLFLEDHDISVQPTQMYTLPTEGVTEFSGARYKGRTVSGMFDYTTQNFLVFVLNNDDHEQFHARFLTGVLEEMTRPQDQALPGDIDPVDSHEKIFSQTLPKVILERELVKTRLEEKGFTLSRDDVQATGADLDRFTITGASLHPDIMFDFVYEKSTRLLHEVVMRTNYNEVQFGDRIYDLDEAPVVFQERMEERFPELFVEES